MIVGGGDRPYRPHLNLARRSVTVSQGWGTGIAGTQYSNMYIKQGLRNGDVVNVITMPN